MMYLGTLGRMVGIKCPTTQRVSLADRYSMSTTLGGSVKVQAGPVGRRAWDISLGKLSTPADVGTLMDFVNGAWGAGPFHFISADAPVVNMLTPASASCDPGTVELRDGAQLLGSPLMNLENDGVAARSVWKNSSGAASLGAPVPVLPDQAVTGSAWVAGNGRLRIEFFDSAGTLRSSAESEPGATGASRLSVTATAPITASAAQLWITGNITQASRPVITWTDTPYEWGEGQGCQKAIIQAVSRDVVKAWRDPRNGRWSDVQFTVQEIG